MRAVILIVIGLVVGAFGTHMLERTINARHAYPRAVMHMMAHHVGAMKNGIKNKQCNPDTTAEHLETMYVASRDIGAAFGTDDKHFNELADKLHVSLQDASQNPPADCAALATALDTIGQHCSDCHMEYR